MKSSSAASLFAALAFSTAAFAQESAAPAACDPNQLSLATDDEDGQFNGMSKSGFLIVVRNLGPEACSLAPVANISFFDAKGKQLVPPHARSRTPGLHPGPVVRPIIIPVKAEITAELMWVSGPVYTHNICVDPARMQVHFGTLTLETAVRIGICWNSDGDIDYNGIRFVPDPVYTAPKPQSM